MNIRPACDADAEAAADVLCRSIRELCVQDHADDGPTIAAWLANKTPEEFREWLAGDGVLLVAERDESVIAVGGFRLPDEIILNYVAPQARFQGVSKAMLAEMERRLRESGAIRARLMSTRTASAFYRAAGYRDAGLNGKHGMATYDMVKEFKS